MKTFLKIAAVGAVLLVAIIAALVFFVFKNLDSLVKSGTEKGLTYALQVPCTVGAAKVDVKGGTIQFDDIHIPNPDGYKSAHAMHFGMVRVEADIQSFRTDKPVIHLIRLSEADIVMEKSSGSSNLQDLMKNAQRLSSGEAAEEKPADEASQKKMLIEKLVVDKTKVGVQVPLIEKTFAVQLPDIEKENIGGEEKPVSPAEALQEIIAILLGSIKDAGAGILPDDLLDGIGNSLRSLPGDLKDRLGDFGGTATDAAGKIAEDTVGTVKDAVGGVDDTAKEAVGDVKKSVEGLFGKKKKADE